MKKTDILIIDDEIEICCSMRDIFAFEDWAADYATTAKDANLKIESKRYDLVVTDIKLEGRISGIDIIKSFMNKLIRPKIIVISAIPRDALNVVFVKEGILGLIDGYLDKPSCSNTEDLIRLISQILQK